MVDIKKLAKLTGIHLTDEEEHTLTPQLIAVEELLNKVKNYQIEQPTTSWHDLLWLASHPSQTGNPDGDSDAILSNVKHPLVGHAIEIKWFVE